MTATHALWSICVWLSVASCVVSAKSNVKILDENNWELLLEGEWMVEFYAPWCPACRALEPVWNDFASWSDDLGINIAQIDVTTSPGLSGRFMVTALPTIYHVKDGVFRQYRGTRDRDEFIGFVEEKKWGAVEPIPSWKSPSSVQMSVVSNFFKLSMLLRNIHTQLTEEHGIPYWGSYLIFAVATIVIGAILGLVLVFLIDCFYPAKVAQKKAGDGAAKKKDDDLPQEPDEDEEDIVDEKGSESDALELEEDEEEAEEVAQEATEKDDTPESEEPAENVAAGSSSPDTRRRRVRKAD